MIQPECNLGGEDCGGESEEVRQGLPGPDWTRDELYARAIWEYKVIEKGEKCTPRYWSCGKFLLEVRKDFGLERWRQWLNRSELLNRTRYVYKKRPVSIAERQITKTKTQDHKAECEAGRAVRLR